MRKIEKRNIVKFVVMEKPVDKEWVSLRDFTRRTYAERYAGLWRVTVPTSKFEVVEVLR